MGDGEPVVVWGCWREGGSAAGWGRGPAAGGQLAEPVLQGGQGGGIEAVIDPAALLAGTDQAGLFEHLEVKRELRLGQIQIGGEVTHAALTAGQRLNHLQAEGFGEGPEQRPGLLGLEGRAGNSTWIGHVIGNTSRINSS